MQVFKGKKALCYTELTDFTDVQGVGADPIYKRYDSVESVVKHAIDEKYRSFLAKPDYAADEDRITWYADEWSELPELFSDLDEDEKLRYRKIKDETLSHYREQMQQLPPDERKILENALKFYSDDYVYCYDGKVVLVSWGMRLNPKVYRPSGRIIKPFEGVGSFKVVFECGSEADYEDRVKERRIRRAEGHVLTKEDLPHLRVKPGYRFAGWEPMPIGVKVDRNLTFEARFEKEEVVSPEPPRPPVPPKKKMFNYRFVAGAGGTLNGPSSFMREEGTVFDAANIPAVTPNKGFRFTGWDVSPAGCIADKDYVFTAQYEQEKRIPWYRRMWLWLTARGCLKWLLWLLLLLLLLGMLLFFLKDCHGGCSRWSLLDGEENILKEDTVAPLRNDRITTDSVLVREDNGDVRDIWKENGERLPETPVVPPVFNNGEMPPIEERPNMPDVIADRLNIWLVDDNADMDGFVREFKKNYPSDDYKVIGGDVQAKWIIITVPPALRNKVREELPRKIKGYDFFVVDESLFEGSGNVSPHGSDPGWHLEAVNAAAGWEITRGSRDVTVAVVDDGFDLSHEMLRGRIVKPYNVFTQSPEVGLGSGHGTHVAGLAAGSTEFLGKGVAGIAPDCKVMPVQVFDNGMCPFSAWVNGLLYAVRNGADVVNMSIASIFQGLDQLPGEMQQELIEHNFKAEERAWKMVTEVAEKHNTILVFAAGNNNVLTYLPPEHRTGYGLNVTAVNRDLRATDFTNYGPGSDISAPGQGICSSFPVNSFEFSDGTSMAAPMVAGTIALMKSLNRNLTDKDVKAILKATGKKMQDNIGPLIQVDKALIMVKTGRIPEEEGVDSAPVPDSPRPEYESGDETDYDAIRRLIREYKSKIEELEKQLPENKK